MNLPQSPNPAIAVAANYLTEQTGGFCPEIGIILGSGLGHFAEQVTAPFIIPYGAIPSFPQTTVQWHAGKLVMGRIKGHSVAVMQGRFHAYEGHSMDVLRRPVEVLHALGVKTLIVTAAVGSVNHSLQAGDLLAIEDHLNLTGRNPLIGTQYPVRPTIIYSPPLIQKAHKAAEALDIPLKTGVYTYVTGPNFETPAEIRMMGYLGGDVVGMSTVPEALTAAYLGMEVLGITYISNLGSGLSAAKLSAEDIDHTMARIKPLVVEFLIEVIDQLGSS